MLYYVMSISNWDNPGAHQEWTEEDERHKVEVGKLAATIWIYIPWLEVTVLTPKTRQHDLMPCLTRCTPSNIQKDYFTYPELNDLKRDWGMHGNVYYRFTELHIKAPKEKHKSLYKGPEVVMLVDGTVSNFFNCNIPKQLSNTMILLKVKTRRWLLIAKHLVFFATKTYRNKDYK